jgi:hypothetical protein
MPCKGVGLSGEIKEKHMMPDLTRKLGEVAS